MSADAILSALDLPGASRVNQRVPKKLLLEHGAPTAADKRAITDGVEELLWVAALKPNSAGVPEFRDETREYVEISVLHLTLRAEAKAARLVELVHRAIPYPLLLMTERVERLEISAGHKRWSQGEAGKTVLDGDVVAVEWLDEQDGERWPAFPKTMALSQQPRTHLYAVYQGWIDSLLALSAARSTGSFAATESPEQAAARREALEECARLDAEAVRLRAKATKEKQMARRVDLNLDLKRVEAALAAARANL